MTPSRAKSRAAGARQSNRLAPADRLKREIQAVLTEELAQDQYRMSHGRYDGFAYVAAEAYFHLAGGDDAGLRADAAEAPRQEPLVAARPGRPGDRSDAWPRARPRSSRTTEATGAPSATRRRASRGAPRRSWSGSAPSVAEERVPGGILDRLWKRGRWTDERLDDLAEAMRQPVRPSATASTRSIFGRAVDHEFDRVPGTSASFDQWISLDGCRSVGFLGVIATILARGA